MTTTAPHWVPTFVPIQLPDRPIAPPPTSMVRIVSYNILAQSYVKSIYFPHSPSPCLRWKNRSKAVLQRLLSFDADVLCLQELDEYESYYRSRLSKEGYGSVYIQRSGRKRDGCGIFFRRKRIELVEEQGIDFNDLVPSAVEANTAEIFPEDESSTGTDPVVVSMEVGSPKKSRSRSRSSSPVKAGAEERGDPNDPCVRLKRDCVAILAAFRILEAPRHIVIIGNTHLYWDPEWADVKLAQAKYLLLNIVKFQESISCKLESTPLVLLSGDFNSTPGDQVYKYVTSGLQEPTSNTEGLLEEYLAKLELCSAPSSEGKILDKKRGKTGGEESMVMAPLPLLSLYQEVLGEHPNTNVTPGFTGTLDYIFFRPSEVLQFINILNLPAPGSPDLEGGLPNHSHPSDHLPVGADFVFH